MSLPSAVAVKSIPPIRTDRRRPSIEPVCYAPAHAQRSPPTSAGSLAAWVHSNRWDGEIEMGFRWISSKGVRCDGGHVGRVVVVCWNAWGGSHHPKKRLGFVRADGLFCVLREVLLDPRCTPKKRRNVRKHKKETRPGGGVEASKGSWPPRRATIRMALNRRFVLFDLRSLRSKGAFYPDPARHPRTRSITRHRMMKK